MALIRRHTAVEHIRVEEVEGIADQMRERGFDSLDHVQMQVVNPYQNGTRLLLIFSGEFDDAHN